MSVGANDPRAEAEEQAALLLEAFVEAQARGEVPDPEAWLAQDPARAAALRQALGGDPLPELLLLASLHQAGQSVSLDASFDAAKEEKPGHSAVLTLPVVLLESDSGVPELVAGSSLAERISKKGPLPVEGACRVLRRAARELVGVHRAGFAHLDLSPNNLIHTEGFKVRIADRALARLAASGPPPERTLDEEGGEAEQVEVRGDLDYVAPERARHPARVTQQSDLYSLGCVFYFLLAGHPPFTDRVGSKKILAHAMEPLRPLPAPPKEEVMAVLERLLAKDPRERFGSAQELIEALDRVIEPAPMAGAASAPAAPNPASSGPAPTRGRGLWLVALALLAGMGIGGAALYLWWIGAFSRHL